MCGAAWPAGQPTQLPANRAASAVLPFERSYSNIKRPAGPTECSCMKRPAKLAGWGPSGTLLAAEKPRVQTATPAIATTDNISFPRSHLNPAEPLFTFIEGRPFTSLFFATAPK